MEHAIMISHIDRLDKLDNVRINYSRIYYGKDFCSKYTISLNEIKKLLEYCKKNDKEFSLLTPIMIDKNIESYRAVLDYMIDRNYKCEIVVNDWGFLYMLNKHYSGKFKLSAGRLINRIKKSPHIMNVIPKLDYNSRKALMTSSGSFSENINLLMKYGVRSMQYENVIQENYLDIDNKIEKHLIYPYVYITSSRNCTTSRLYNDRSFDRFDLCSNICEREKLELYNDDVKCRTVLIGNSMFYVNNTIPENLCEFKRFIHIV